MSSAIALTLLIVLAAVIVWSRRRLPRISQNGAMILLILIFYPVSHPLSYGTMHRKPAAYASSSSVNCRHLQARRHVQQDYLPRIFGTGIS